MASSPTETSYDRWAGFYDRLIPNRLYSRVIWGTHPNDYRAFARAAVADADGPLLDAVGGTAVFTADAYRGATREIVVADLSEGMLERARQRLGDAPHVTFVQADATAPPFEPGSFATVACMSALHVFPDPAAAVRGLWPLVAPGGRLFVSGMVAETAVGSRYLKLLHRAGEAGTPMSEAAMRDIVTGATGAAPEGERRGSMTYLTVRR
jgi:ubiquinone/menaquinone biosynthesis C-methylase UbiE